MPTPAMHWLALALSARAHWAGAWRRVTAVDMAFALTLGAWTAFMCLPAQGVFGEGSPAWAELALQLTLLGTEASLLLAAGLWGPHARLVWGVHTGVTLLCLLAGQMDISTGQAHAALVGCNIGFVVALLLALGGHAWRERTGLVWALLLVAVPVCAVLLSDMPRLGLDAAYRSRFQPVVGLELVLAWLALPRLTGAATRRDDERHRQLAQDLHDGVGSHLTSLIAALERGTPAQRGTAAALQDCLLELKLLVDGAHTQGSVVAHLANLRYRMQPLLDLAGIAMDWQLAPSAPLERLRGDAATQVLRIAQEALANVVRHSGARAVTVRCTAVAAPPNLLLEIRDDGRGLLAPAHPDSGGAARLHGRGLAGMRARAARLGGSLQIESAVGGGTCVRLQVPIASGSPARKTR